MLQTIGTSGSNCINMLLISLNLRQRAKPKRSFTDNVFYTCRYIGEWNRLSFHGVATQKQDAGKYTFENIYKRFPSKPDK